MGLWPGLESSFSRIPPGGGGGINAPPGWSLGATAWLLVPVSVSHWLQLTGVGKRDIISVYPWAK